MTIPAASQTTLSSAETTPIASTRSSRLMPDLARLSLSTSRPTLLSPEPKAEPTSYAGRTLRMFSAGSKEVYRRSGLGGIIGQTLREDVSSMPGRSTLDTSNILYPTLQSHPAPAPFPILVLSLSEINHVSPLITNDELFDVLLRRLEPWVGEEGEGGYVLVVSAADDKTASSRSWPNLAWWLWRWKRIPRKYRKNLKRLYIVHPSMFTRTLLPLVLPLVSPKSYPKLHPLPSLISLAKDYHVSLAGLDVPLQVLREEAKVLRSRSDSKPPSSMYRDGKDSDTDSWTGTITSTLSYASSYIPSLLMPSTLAGHSRADDERPRGVLNRKLDDLLHESDGRVPASLSSLGVTIGRYCNGTEGVFRRSTNSPLLAPILAILDLPLDQHPNMPWNTIAEEDPLLPPQVLLRVLRCLAEPLLSTESYPCIRNTTSEEDLKTTFIPHLSKTQKVMLDFIVGILRQVAKAEETTKMSPMSLAIVLAPNLISGPDAIEDAQLCIVPGKALPAGLDAGHAEKREQVGKGGTLVGVLEMRIRLEP